MRKLCCFIVAFFWGAIAFSQTRDTFSNDTTRGLSALDANSTGKHKEVLCVVDGVIFKGDITKIDPRTILNVSILKPPGSVNIYGRQGANGAVVITTRAYKKSGTENSDSFNKVIPSVGTYIIDGVVSDKKDEGVDAEAILSVKIISKEKAAQLFYGARNGIVVIVTKAGATRTYQNKLGRFSSQYKKYVEWQMKYNHNDRGILYMIVKNKESVILNDENKISELYNLPLKKIQKVEFYKKETCCGTNTSLIITEKN